jgi:hypothetical protein
MGDNERIVAGAGAIVAVAGGVWAVLIEIYLAITDVEYAKHDQSLYALFEFLNAGGWMPMLMIIIGGLLWFWLGYMED